MVGRMIINKPQMALKFCNTLIDWRKTNYFEKIHKAMCLLDYIVAVRLQKKTVKWEFRVATSKVSNKIQRGKSSSVDLCCTPRIDRFLGLRDQWACMLPYWTNDLIALPFCGVKKFNFSLTESSKYFTKWKETTIKWTFCCVGQA